MELYKLKQQIDQLYLGVLYLDAQKKQTELIEKNIQIGIKNVQAQVQNGIAFRSNLDVLKAELLKTQQRIIELDASRKGMTETLELFINKPLADDVTFEQPLIPLNNSDTKINRPEIKIICGSVKIIRSANKNDQGKKPAKGKYFFAGRLWQAGA